MQLSNLETLPNHTITERLDVVYGSTMRSKHVGKDFCGGVVFLWVAVWHAQ